MIWYLAEAVYRAMEPARKCPRTSENAGRLWCHRNQFLRAYCGETNRMAMKTSRQPSAFIAKRLARAGSALLVACSAGSSRHQTTPAEITRAFAYVS
jgi:hypothetical protein